MSRWIVISAYSIGTPYEEEIKILEASLLKFKVPYKFYPYRSRGSWANNCEHNATIIQRAFRQLQRNLVWLDSDAEVLAYPSLFNTYKYDIGLYKRMHTPEQCKELGTKHHWDTGTMFMRYKPEVIEMMFTLNTPMNTLADSGDGWIIQSFNKHVDNVISGRYKSNLRIGILPVTYSYIFNTKQPEELEHKHEVVIKHNQASRRFKYVI